MYKPFNKLHMADNNDNNGQKKIKDLDPKNLMGILIGRKY